MTTIMQAHDPELESLKMKARRAATYLTDAD